MKTDLIESLAQDVRRIYDADRSRAESIIEDYLTQRSKEYAMNEKVRVLRGLADHLAGPREAVELDHGSEKTELKQLISSLLGKEVAMDDLSEEEIAHNLTLSLNTIFDTLNQIIGIIHDILLGEKSEIRTIRKLLYSNLQDEGGLETLTAHLDQIKDAFLVSHRAFQNASGTMVKQILDELEPGTIGSGMEGGLKFGPFRKAQLFDAYCDKFRACEDWFNTGRFMNEMMREFEKECQKLFKSRKGARDDKDY